MTRVPHVTMTRSWAEESATVRITGGGARGRRVSAPEGLEVRPTGVKVRQAFFNILGVELKGCRFLDLFAGTGLMGIEAMSRGAACLVAVEEQRKLVQAIQLNVIQLDFHAAQILCDDVRKALARFEPERFDIIFADPPYKSGLGEPVLELVNRHKVLSAPGVLVIEHLKSIPLSKQHGRLALVDSRSYGQTALSFYRHVESFTATGHE